MLLLNCANLTKSFSGETLFENVSFNVFSSDRIGLVGVNGVGKSTLFKIIIGSQDYDSGEVSKSKETNIGYLDQYPISNSDRSLMDEMLTLCEEVIEIEKQLEEIHLEISNNSGDLNALITKQTALQERYMQLDGTYYKSKLKGILKGLGFSEEEFSMPLSKLSGGQKTRLALSKILFSNTNLLLLDEPTNHLDIESVEWLEGYLKNYKGAFIVVSHDRFFLDRVTNKTFDLRNGSLYTYNGNYSAFVTQHEQEREYQQSNYDRTIKEIHRLEEVVEQQRVWKRKKNRKTHTLDNTRKAIERLENSLVEPEKDESDLYFRFKACEGGAKHVLITEELSMQFGDNKLFEHVNMDVKKGEKIFLLGPNGCGKTTLIRILMSQLLPTSGKFKIGDNICVGYYDQLRESLHREKTVINEVWDEHPELTQTQVRSALALFLFRGDDVFKEVKSLSGGELARLELTKILLKKINFLIMDEPTNHLDITSREALEKTLSEYDGTMFMVSHDRYFINRLASRIFYLTPNGIVEYEGNYESYLEGKKAVDAVYKVEEKTVINESENAYKQKKRSDSERRKTQNRIAKLEKLIEELENKIPLVEKELEDPEVANNYSRLSEVSSRLEELRNQLNDYSKEWEELLLSLEDN